MHAIQLSSLVKDPSELRVSQVPDAIPESNEYVVDIYACGMNFFDLLQIRGKYQNQPKFPWVAGSEFSGIVTATPPNNRSNKFKTGDRVFGAGQGAFATKICVPETQLQPIPEGWSFREAAALYLTGPTSFAGLTLRAQLKKGDWTLIHGAAGGVGLCAIQVAKAVGARVIAVTTGSSNIEVCKSYGSDHVVDYVATSNWDEEVMKVTSNHGVDVVWDTVGLVSQSLKCAAFGARVVVVGFVAGRIESIKTNRILLKNISVVGIHWGAYSEHEPETIPKVWEGLFKLIDDGKFRSIVFQAQGDKGLTGLNRVGSALQLLENRTSWGKVVVDASLDTTVKL